MFKIVENKIVPNVEINNDEIYNNNTIIIEHIGCYYILILNQKNDIKQTYITISKPKITPSKINKLIYTNDYTLWGYYIKSRKPQSFSGLDDYKDWLKSKADSIKIININNLNIFDELKLQSKSQLINYEIIYNWWHSIKRSIKFYPKQQLKVYNFYNFTLYLLSRNNFNLKNEYINHNLKINISDNRCINNNSLINFLNIKNDSNIWGQIKPNNGNIFFKVDYSSSYIQLLSIVLDCPIQENDKYYYFYKQFKVKEEYNRNEIKKEVFRILFSPMIGKYLHIQFFEKAYSFSTYLQQLYIQHGYITTLLSQKKIILDNQSVRTRKNLLLNRFIMTLQTQLYLGVLYNLLNIDINMIRPIIFIYDSFIFQIDYKVQDQKIKQINKILEFNGLLGVSQYIGRSLNKLEQIY